MCRHHDRHHIPNPNDTGQDQRKIGMTYVDGLKERMHDLFKTAQGLPGHKIQIQQEINRLRNSNDITSAGKTLLFERIKDQLKKAAEYCTFDFPQQKFTIGDNEREIVISRTNGTVKAYRTW